VRYRDGSSGRVGAARRRFAGLRRALTLLALLTFAVQGYLVQTHIHGLPLTVAAMQAGTQAVSAPAQPDKSPLDNDSANCPLCQEFLHAGNFLLPAAIAALPPMLAVFAIVPATAPILAAKSASHLWIGRAPPQA